MIYGANASGKSNLVRGFGFFRHFVLRSSKSGCSPTCRPDFRFDPCPLSRSFGRIVLEASHDRTERRAAAGDGAGRARADHRSRDARCLRRWSGPRCTRAGRCIVATRGRAQSGDSPQMLRSMQAFWRDLPGLLEKRRNRGKWAAYHGEERVAITRSRCRRLSGMPPPGAEPRGVLRREAGGRSRRDPSVGDDRVRPVLVRSHGRRFPADDA